MTTPGFQRRDDFKITTLSVNKSKEVTVEITDDKIVWSVPDFNYYSHVRHDFK